MSNTKFVKRKGNGFWAYDVALGVFLKYFIDAVEQSPEADAAWLSSRVSSWRVAACIQDIGLTLDMDWSAEQWRLFVSIAEKACARLAARDSIPTEEIVSWRLLDDKSIHLRGATEVPTAPVVELGRAIIALVCGELPESPRDEAWLYGTPTGRSTIQMENP